MSPAGYAYGPKELGLAEYFRWNLERSRCS